MLKWDSERLGEEIKNLRLMAGITQKELADGVNLSQAAISKLENGNTGNTPNAPNLLLIAEFLGYPIDYFFLTATHTSVDYAKNVKEKIRDYIKNQDYENAYSYIKRESKQRVFQENRVNQQFLKWQEGVALYYINNNKEETLSLLEEALSLSICSPKLQSERNIEILNSIGITHFESKDMDSAIETFEKALKQYKKIPYIEEATIKTKLFYNLAKTYTRKKEYDYSNELCLEAIKWTVDHHRLRLLGKLHYHIGFNYLQMKKYSEAHGFLSKSIVFLEVENDHKSLQVAKEKLELTSKKLKG
ncbi:helix-turn-helix domain-containing protein [Bacillus suaedaesalsae]|uniref:Helix-turn-helix transcriptional regulator n=1 Tax=Bacillus suaedaesalsae TaxID=2810349 RepID=A0ABS2DL07_9BACI|nr:helix-turn-helix domain-containing protein [Bacillus suaedaesalsae]MBM6619175.1 helix-turn-helix transcriptional regulator [Bacillus suaedaesalsae]